MDWKLDETRHTGRPGDSQGRSPAEMACYDFLDRLGVSYGRVDHSPAFHIETCHQVEAVLEAPIAKNLFLCNRQKTQFYLLLLEGDKVFKTKHLSAQLGCSRLSFAGGRGSGPASGSSARLRQPSVPAPGPGLRRAAGPGPSPSAPGLSGAASLSEHLHPAHCHGGCAGAR